MGYNGPYSFRPLSKKIIWKHALRTGMQDSNPEADDVSRIYAVVPQGDGWYLVSYCDMGWPGKTRIRIADGKIDDYEHVNP